jgi:formylglycine-generating enzyme required for sulfatase activity
VASFEKGASPFGALGMVGNVWEWVDEPRTPSAEAIRRSAPTLNPPPTANEPWYVMRGGSYAEKLLDGVLYDVATVPGRYHNKTTGFRCAKTP